MSKSLHPMFNLGQTLITGRAFQLLSHQCIAPSVLLEQHTQLLPAMSVGVHVVQRLQAILAKQLVHTRFALPFKTVFAAPEELWIVTEAGHLATTVLLATEA